ncbi:MAG: hypothetical protein Q4F97_10005 [Bacteroidales bacterium]|nr:hypothetical protein [Bacteroidales bacterium]
MTIIKRVLIACSFFCVLPVLGQNNPVSLFTKNNPHQFMFSLGAYPITYIDGDNFFYGDDDFFNSDDDFFDNEKGWSYLSKKAYTPSINFFYSYQLKSWLSLGASLSYSSYSETHRNQLTDDIQYKKKSNFLALTPIVRFDWFRMSALRIYSGIGIGGAFYKRQEMNRKDNSFSPSFSITYLGMTVGKRIYGFGEINSGTNGIFSIGIGYRFGHKKESNEK